MSNYEIIELSNEGMEAISGGGTVNIDSLQFDLSTATVDDINIGGDVYDIEGDADVSDVD